MPSVSLYTSAGLMTNMSSGFMRVREKGVTHPTWHAMHFYFYTKSADKLHYMPADKKEPGHFCCKAKTHPCLGALVTCPASPQQTALGETTGGRFAQLG